MLKHWCLVADDLRAAAAAHLFSHEGLHVVEVMSEAHVLGLDGEVGIVYVSLGRVFASMRLFIAAVTE